MFSKCSNCGFNVRQNDKFCLNCGNSYENLTFSQEYRIGIYTFQISTIVLIISILIFKRSLNDFILIFVFSGVLSLLIGLIVELIRQSFRETKTKNKFLQHTLHFKDSTIKKRLQELSARKSNISTVLGKIGDNPSKTLQNIQQPLLSAQQLISNQIQNYKLQKNKIQLVRLQNEVLPYLEIVEVLKDYQIENGVIVTEQTMREVAEIAQDLSKNAPQLLQNEQQQFLEQLQETAKSCEKLREILLSKQALRALQGVQPIEDLNLPIPTNELSHTIETFNIQATLTEFSESFEQLENEYRRLLADNEVSQKLLNFES